MPVNYQCDICLKNFNHKGRWLFTNQYGSYPDPLYGYNS